MESDEIDRPSTRFGSVQRLGRALELVWEGSRGWTLLSSGLVLVEGLLPLVTLYLLKLIFDAVSLGFAEGDAAEKFPEVALYVGLMGLAVLTTNLVGSLAGLVTAVQGQLVAKHTYEKVHAKSLEVDLDHYENPIYLDTMERAQSEAGHRPVRILTGLQHVARSAVSLVALGSLLVAFHWIVGFVLIAAALPATIVRVKFSDLLYRWEVQRTETHRVMNYYDWLLSTSFAAKEIRLFGLGDFFSRRFSELQQKLIGEEYQIATRRLMWDGATQSLGAVAIFGTYAFIAQRALTGAITIGDLAMYYQALQRSQAFLREFLEALARLFEDSLFLESLDEFLTLQPSIRAPESPRPIPSPIREGVVFRGVGFQYPNSERKVLEDVDLEIRPGEMVALVGENGAGKTSIAKLLCRLYDPDSGSITIDGVDLRECDPNELRRQIGVVFQDYGQYQLSAQENIWLGNVEHPLDLAQIESAARESGAHDIITKLPQGYETPLGKWFEDGEELSIGEWQKVALARAYLRKAEILVLDEPTSALDAKSELEVFEHLRNLTRDRAALVISHRFSTVRMADRIHVINEGRIVETGSHRDLMALKGHYASLFEMQASRYRAD